MPDAPPKRSGGRPRSENPRTISVAVFLTPDEWSEAELLCSARGWYELPAFMRELLKREIASKDGADLLGEDVAARARREAAAARDRRLARRAKNARRAERDLSVQTEPVEPAKRRASGDT